MQSSDRSLGRDQSHLAEARPLIGLLCRNMITGPMIVPLHESMVKGVYDISTGDRERLWVY